MDIVQRYTYRVLPAAEIESADLANQNDLPFLFLCVLFLMHVWEWLSIIAPGRIIASEHRCDQGLPAAVEDALGPARKRLLRLA